MFGGTAAPSTGPRLPSPQSRQPGFSLSVSTSPRTSAATAKRLVLMSGFTERRGGGTWAGSCTPKDLFSSGLDWNVVLPEFDSLCNVDEDKIPSLHEGLYRRLSPGFDLEDCVLLGQAQVRWRISAKQGPLFQASVELIRWGSTGCSL